MTSMRKEDDAMYALALFILAALGAQEGPVKGTPADVTVRLATSFQRPLPTWGGLPVAVTIENSGSSECPFGEPLRFGEYGGAKLELVITSPTGQETALVPDRGLDKCAPLGATMEILRPGGAASLGLMVSGSVARDLDKALLSRFDPVFTAAGEYSIVATYEWRQCVYKSNAIVVDVAADSGDGALEYIKSMARPWLIYFPHLLPTSGFDPSELEELADGWRGVYSACASITLTHYYLRLAHDALDATERESALGLAERHVQLTRQGGLEEECRGLERRIDDIRRLNASRAK